MQRRRYLPIIITASIVFLGGIMVGYWTNVREAPLRVGQGGEATPEVTAEAGTLTLPRPLAFNGNPTGDWDIFVLAPDGTLTNLTAEGSAHDYFPSWALDGGQINFISNRGSPDEMGPSQVQPDGSGLRSLSILSAIFTLVQEGRFDWDPGWSPDGTRLLWSSLRDFNLELYTIPTASDFAIANATRLTNHPGRDWFGAWSPDGTRIVLASDRNGNEDLFILDATGGEPRLLVDGPWDEIRGQWSLDGKTILYVHDEDDAMLVNGQLSLMLIDADGQNNRPLGDAVFAGGRVWSPEGYSAYATNEGGQWHILVSDPDGMVRLRITPEDGDYLFPVWGP